MDTTAQAATNPKIRSVRMTTCKVPLKEDAQGIYLYQEQALTQQLDNPYRQRILAIKTTADPQVIASESFKPVQPQTLVGFCQRPEAMRQISKQDLGESICQVFLKPIKNGYQGETPPQGCPANVRGAVKVTNTVILHSGGMDTWDRGFDAQGKQVWGAENESYQYRWITPQSP